MLIIRLDKKEFQNLPNEARTILLHSHKSYSRIYLNEIYIISGIENGTENDTTKLCSKGNFLHLAVSRLNN